MTHPNAKISGHYKLDNKGDLRQFLLALNVPQEIIEEIDKECPTLEIVLDADKITYTGTVSRGTRSTVLILNQEVNEPIAKGISTKSTTTLNGDTLTITSKGFMGKFVREMKFSDKQMTMTISNPDAGGVKPTLIFKRIK